MVCWDRLFLLALALQALGKVTHSHAGHCRTERQEDLPRVVFATALPTYSSVKQALAIADELRSRGQAEVGWILPQSMADLVEERGFHDVFRLDDEALTASYLELSQFDPDRHFWRYIFSLRAIFKSIANGYEKSLLKGRDRLNAENISLIVLEMFSSGLIDAADETSTPTAILYSSPLGHLFGFEDSWATPDALVADTVKNHLQSFRARLRKSTSSLFTKGLGLVFAGLRMNAVRRRHGLPLRLDPAAAWVGKLVFCTWNPALMPPRTVSPTTVVTGFVATKYRDESDTGEKSDVMQWLDEQHRKGGSVVYIAFGSSLLGTCRPVETAVAGALRFTESNSNQVTVLLAARFHDNAGKCEVMNAKGVRAENWVSQGKVLGHAAVRSFVTHGGQMSIGEAVMNEVPMVVMPLFGDQIQNAVRVVEAGIGERVSHFDRDAVAKTASSLSRLHQNNTVARRLARVAALNEPSGRGGAAVAADWIEQSARHGTDHLVSLETRAGWVVASGADIMAFRLVLLFVVCTGPFLLRTRLMRRRKTGSVNNKT